MVIKLSMSFNKNNTNIYCMSTPCLEKEILYTLSEWTKGPFPQLVETMNTDYVYRVLHGVVSCNLMQSNLIL